MLRLNLVELNALIDLVVGSSDLSLQCYTTLEKLERERRRVQHIVDEVEAYRTVEV